MQQQELKSCPFCGGDAYVSGCGVFMACYQCPAEMPITDRKVNETAKVWNSRAAIAEAQKPVRVRLEEIAEVMYEAERMERGEHLTYSFKQAGYNPMMPDCILAKQAKAVIESLIKQGVKVYVE
jgi:hypothetical protein